MVFLGRYTYSVITYEYIWNKYNTCCILLQNDNLDDKNDFKQNSMELSAYISLQFAESTQLARATTSMTFHPPSPLISAR